MHSLEQYAVILRSRESLARIANPPITLTSVGVRSVWSGGVRDDQDFTAGTDGHSIDLRVDRGIDLAQLLGEQLGGVVADVLPEHAAIGFDAKQHAPAAMI